MAVLESAATSPLALGGATLPIGVGVSKTVVLGKTPWKFGLQYWHYVERPNSFGPKYQIRFQFAPVVPLPW